MNVCDNNIAAEGLSKFFQNLGKSSIKEGTKIDKNVIKNSGRVSEI